MSKCQVCKTNEQTGWIWQPFGPGVDYKTFTVSGSHYRGFATLHICDQCLEKIKGGVPTEFIFKKHRYIACQGTITHIPEHK